MPRPQKTLLERISHADLAYAAQRLVTLGKARAEEIVRYAQERPARIVALEKELLALRTGLAHAVDAAKNAVSSKKSTSNGAKGVRRFTMTPKMKLARKLQGQYLGLLRALDAKARVAVKKIAQEKGVRAALQAGQARRKSRPK